MKKAGRVFFLFVYKTEFRRCNTDEESEGSRMTGREGGAREKLKQRNSIGHKTVEVRLFIGKCLTVFVTR